MNTLDFVSVAGDLAREAGQLLIHHYGRVDIEYKGAFDLVTAADRASEKLVVERLRARFPSHSIVGEEGARIEGSSDYVWYIDPLDGTTNFAHRFPTFAVSLGLARAGKPVAGVVFDPSRDEFFSAEQGSGAYLNSHRVHVSAGKTFSQGLYATGFASDNRKTDSNVHFFHQMSMLTHGVRRTGSAALDLCYVACGRLEGFWEFGLKPWDVAAGLLLISEAGGVWGDMRGGPYQFGGPHLAASNGAVHQELLNVFEEISRGQLRAPVPAVQI